ncbi:hypothetical protein EHI8A_002590 [Entamoeba histolytica HM-1:IMSS-B]|uniref:Uncharacterized protein n=5 Tax=Entamoeba histolytica TaxID=5759 RepID=C4LVT6_ENTH1|nr:hypothetical protein EHI_187190 [Entamoeba histolytica HM-1:IMSS]EMD47817.1 Hypothetical protein EHI5A_003110 [Entamoeba histolytica KU27]EMH76906.1 hypothetical protein EHI8A_002590 [Entamoeba histolytica HM-1:IMSS-B]ENY59929.1 hypothetical protein EHI7A_004340 [Entamoeba histolytica HM-1:IMSS-A]GAT92792.1 hypothetical protein CL6EHI_187190 [Entamoeba histolytica]EAL51083.1 hypothetical protein EHI_187190 [Entamoeba histolytica HM-1:IMSS]|eukprot:XP_656467.1 hypothetical protein EHI_187190 [Entamoeba histolytica HM-1:IMSS]
MDKTQSDVLAHFLEQELSVDQKVKRIQRKVAEYMKNYNYDEYVDNPTKRLGEKIKDVEGVLDRMDETKQRTDVVIRFAQDTINDMIHWIDDINAVIESIITSTNKVATRNNELVLRLKDMEHQLFEEKINVAQSDTEKKEIQRKYNKQISDVNEMRIEIKNSALTINTQNEIIQVQIKDAELRRKNQELKEQIELLKQENMVLKEEVKSMHKSIR